MVGESREAALTRAARSGQVPAFNQLVQAYESLVYNLAFWIVGDPQIALDVTQGTFLRAAQRFSRLRQGSAKLWLMRILVETCRGRLSRPQPPAAGGLTPVLAEDRQVIPDHALRECQDRALQAGINGLSLEHRIVLVLSDIGDLNYNDIAASTGVSKTIVRSRLGQGRAGLRDALWAKGTPLPDPASTDPSQPIRQTMGNIL